MATHPQPVVVHSNIPTTNVIVQSIPPQPEAPLHYAKKQSLIIGIIQLLAGVLSIVLNIAVIATIQQCFTAGNIGYGFWCGVFYLVSGALGVAGSRNPTYCLLVGHMVMSIVSACFAGIQLIIGSISAGVFRGCYYYSYSESRYYDGDVNKGFSLALVVVALVEAAMAIWASAICCAAMCCRTPSSSGTVLVQSPQQQMLTTGQVIYPQPQPFQQQQLQFQQQQQQQPPQQQYAYPHPQYLQNVAATAPEPPAYSDVPPSYPSK